MKAPLPNYEVGQIVAMPAYYDPHMLAQQRLYRSLRQRDPNLVGHHPAVAAARKTMAGRVEAAARAADPFEQARTWLRRRGFSPVALIGKEHHVGRHRFDSAEALMAFARAKGWRA